MSNNELSVNKNLGYMNLANFNVSEGFSDELIGLESGFDRIKIPAGGGTTFELSENDQNDVEAVKDFSAVILFHHPLYSFYSTKYTGNNNPPDCSSTDGTFGIGNPGGICANCANNKFGSGENGSKSCKNKHQIYLLREGEIFPVTLLLPASSLKELSRYIKRLLSSGKKSDEVVTKFSLKKAINKGGISYSQAQLAVSRNLTEEELPLVKGLANEVKLYVQNNTFISCLSEKSVDSNTGEVLDLFDQEEKADV